MKNTKLKSLAAALAMTLAIGAVPPVSGVSELPVLTTTVEAAARKVSLKVSNKKAYVGKTTKISAKATKGARLSYKTSNKKIATVNSKGVIKGKKAGTVKITITAKKSKYKTVKKTITVKVYRQKQKITASNVKLTTGQRRNLGAKARTRLSYKSSNPKIVTVDKKGNLTAKKTGTAKIKITASASGTYNKASRTITVTVVKKKAASRQTESVKPAQPPKQTETARPTEPPKQTETTRPTEPPKQTETTKPVDPPKETETEAPSPTKPPKETETEAPSPTKPPKETETEVPKPTEPPKETEVPGPTEEPKPDVSYVTELDIERTADDTLYVGSPKECNVKWKATGNTTRKDFIYASSDTSIATVDENGTITPLKAGKVTITVTSKTPFAASAGADCLSTSKRYTVKVQYNDAYIGVGFPDPVNVAETGRNVDIGATINPMKEDTGDYSVKNMEKYLEFSSSDPSVATIDAQGNITGVSKGYVTLTVKTKLPIDPNGQYYKESSVTYHVGDYTYEEILNGLTMDAEAGQAAHEVMNDLRQNPEHRNFFKDEPSYPTREWSDGLLRDAATRASRNIVCMMLGGWADDEKSTVNPLASHGGAFNGYGGSGWTATGTELGAAASVFFEDAGHFGNETDPYEKYEAIAVVQYKNAAGINLTSMIVQASPKKTHYLENGLEVTEMPHDQYYDFCSHFNLPMDSISNLEASYSSGISSDEIFTDGSDIQENEPVLADPAPAVAESEEAGFENEESDSEEIDIEDSDSFENEIDITEE